MSVAENGTLYSDYIEQIVITDNRKERCKVIVMIGDGKAEEAPDRPIPTTHHRTSRVLQRPDPRPQLRSPPMTAAWTDDGQYYIWTGKVQQIPENL